MNKLLSKLLCAFIILFGSHAANGGSTSDTSKLLANAKVKSEYTKTVVKEANVHYPTVLADHMDETLDYVQSFSKNKRQYLINTYKRGKSFFPRIVTVFKKYHLPQELKVLIALESAFNANALSYAGARGYWQFMDAPAKEYGLKIVESKDTAAIRLKKKDDRTNLAKSTLAAAKYLNDRAKNLNNNLLLMVASYNWGIGNVRNAMRKTGKNNPDFWDIKKYLPTETKNYVMNFIALNVIFENYDKFSKNQLVFNPETIEVPITDNISKINTSIIE